MASKKKSRSRKRSPARRSRAGACTLKKCAALAARRSKRISSHNRPLALPAAPSLSREQLRPWLSKQEGSRKLQLRPWLAKRAKTKKAKSASLEQLRPWLSKRAKKKKSRAEQLRPWLAQRASSDPNRRSRKKKSHAKRHLKRARRDASYRNHSTSYGAPPRAERRDYREAAPIKRARSAVYGWQKRFKKQKRRFGGERPQNPGAFGGQRRPVLFTPHKGKERDRDWPREIKRHSYAAAHGWQKRFRKNKAEYPGRRPEREFFRGARPVKSTLAKGGWPPPKRKSARGRDYSHRVYKSKSSGGSYRDADSRDWKRQPIRHARASALGWQRKFSKDRKRKRRAYPGKRPETKTFFGRRPVRSSAQRDHRAYY